MRRFIVWLLEAYVSTPRLATAATLATAFARDLHLALELRARHAKLGQPSPRQRPLRELIGGLLAGAGWLGMVVHHFVR